MDVKHLSLSRPPMPLVSQKPTFRIRLIPDVIS